MRTRLNLIRHDPPDIPIQERTIMTHERRMTRLALMVAVSTLALGGGAYAQGNHAQMQPDQGKQSRGNRDQAQHQQGSQAGDRSRGAQSAQSQRAPMEYRQVRGTIQDVRRVQVRGSERPATLVLLRTQQGNRVVADLGTERLGIRLRQGEQLAVRGRPVSVGGQRIILQANAVRYGGRTLDVNRPAPAMAQSQGPATEQGWNSATNLGPYDANSDARFSVGELAMALYPEFDTNNDNMLSVAEWNQGMDHYFGEGDLNLEVSQWDRNGNGRISRNEFRTALGRSGLYEQIDADGDGAVTSVEFGLTTQAGVADAGVRENGARGLDRRAFRERAAAAGIYESFDTDQDQRVSRDEFAANLYSTWDADADNQVTRSEFERSNGWFGDEEDLFQDWDDDRSGSLSEGEFTTGVEQAGTFERYDANDSGWFEQTEFYEATHAGWDRDGDGVVGSDEWASSSSLYEEEGLF